MKWNQNDKGFVPYWKQNTKKDSGCYCAEFRSKGFGHDFVCGQCTGEDASLEAMEKGIALAERDTEW